MRTRPRWIDILLLLPAFAVLNVLGKIYHQWILGIVAAVAMLAVTEGIYRLAAGRTRSAKRKPTTPQHAVIVYLDRATVRAEAEQNDLSSIETELQGIIDAQGLGEYDGNEIGDGGAVLFMYGPDGERLFQGVEAALRAYPLCKKARVLIRPGPPGTAPREVRL